MNYSIFIIDGMLIGICLKIILMTTIILIAAGIIGFGIFYKAIDFFETI